MLSLEKVVTKYQDSKQLSRGTRDQYASTLRKWSAWGRGKAFEELDRKDIRDFLDWVHQRAIALEGTNPGRTANKVRENLRAVMAWAWERDLIESLPRFPSRYPQRDVAGRHYLTKSEINSLYFATHRLERPRGWKQDLPVGHYWRCALVVFFNYGVDTGTIWGTSPDHEPILWRHVFWSSQCPDREIKQRSRWGWIYYRRTKTSKSFVRPMNRAVHTHLKSMQVDAAHPDDPVVLGGSSRPNRRFQKLCAFAGIRPKSNIETNREAGWLLKDLRKTCATYYDVHVPESSIEILGHALSGVTYRHYAHRAPLAFKAITTLPQPSSFLSMVKGTDGACPCCRRRFPDV